MFISLRFFHAFPGRLGEGRGERFQMLPLKDVASLLPHFTESPATTGTHYFQILGGNPVSQDQVEDHSGEVVRIMPCTK